MSDTLLIIGGSGFVSGTLARRAVAAGWRVWVVTRGQRPVADDVSAIVADRKQPEAFSAAVVNAMQAADIERFDLVVDCIGYDPADATQDVEVFRQRARQLVFVSTDFVFDPDHRRFPQGEVSEHYLTEGYGGNKRLCELELMNGDTGDMCWTVVRPCHIYGPGSQLGCLPEHGRDRELLKRMRAGETLRLVGGGHFLQQPILAQDLADLMLGMAGRTDLHQRIFQAAGPDIVESVTYYQIIADIVGVQMQVEEVPVAAFLTDNPAAAPFLCHRIYDLRNLRQVSLPVPATPLSVGLEQQVKALDAEARGV